MPSGEAAEEKKAAAEAAAGGQPACVTESSLACHRPGETAPTKDDNYSYSCVVNLDACSAPSYGRLGTGPSTGCTGDQVCCSKPKCPSGTGAGATTAKKPPTVYNLTNPLGKEESIPKILGRIISTFLGIVGALALAVFVYGGVMWMTARGDAGQVKKGQDALKNAAIGLFIIMFSYGLTSSYLKFWTQQQADIAAVEGRTVEAETPAGAALPATVGSTLPGAPPAGATEGLGGAGAAAGVTPPPSSSTPPPGCEGLTGVAYTECVQGSIAGWLGEGQSAYSTPAPSQGFGGQPSCPQPSQYPESTYKQRYAEYTECMNTKSNIGWKTVCGETVFDSGYGSFNGAYCAAYDKCPGRFLSGDCGALLNAASVGGAIPLNQIKCDGVPSPLGFGSKCGTNMGCCKP